MNFSKDNQKVMLIKCTETRNNQNINTQGREDTLEDINAKDAWNYSTLNLEED